MIWKIGWKKILIDIDYSQIKKWMLNLFLKLMINLSCCLSFSYQSELIITPTGRGPLGREALGSSLISLQVKPAQHMMIPWVFRTRTHSAPEFSQLPHQPPKNWRTFIIFFLCKSCLKQNFEPFFRSLLIENIACLAVAMLLLRCSATATVNATAIMEFLDAAMYPSVRRSVGPSVCNPFFSLRKTT